MLTCRTNAGTSAFMTNHFKMSITMCFLQAVSSAAPELVEDHQRDKDVVNRREQERKGKPLSLKWPYTPSQQAAFLFLLPITFPLWLTLPDVRNPVRNLACIWRTDNGTLTILVVFFSFVLQKSESFVAATFLGSLVWIYVFSYLMLWWAHPVRYCLYACMNYTATFFP